MQPLLNKLGLWKQLDKLGHRPSYGNRSVWGRSEPYDQDFISHVHGRGWHLDRDRFELLLEDAARQAGATWRRGVRVMQVTPDHRTMVADSPSTWPIPSPKDSP